MQLHFPAISQSRHNPEQLDATFIHTEKNFVLCGLVSFFLFLFFFNQTCWETSATPSDFTDGNWVHWHFFRLTLRILFLLLLEKKRLFTVMVAKTAQKCSCLLWLLVHVSLFVLIQIESHEWSSLINMPTVVLQLLLFICLSFLSAAEIAVPWHALHRSRIM